MADVKATFSGKETGIRNAGIHDYGKYAVIKFEDGQNSKHIFIGDADEEIQTAFKKYFAWLTIQAYESREEGVTDGVLTTTDVEAKVDEKIVERVDELKPVDEKEVTPK